MNVHDGTIRNIPTNVEYVSDMDLSPDGARLAFTSYQGSSNSIWLANGDGCSLRKITGEGASETYPRLTPDGKWLVYSYR